MPAPPSDTDPAVLARIGLRLARRRLQLNLTQAELGREAGVSKRTIARIEGGESTQLTNFIRIVRALGWLGNLDAFLPPPAPSPLEQLRLQGKVRKRASGRVQDPASEEWTWGDEPDADSEEPPSAPRGDSQTPKGDPQ